MQAETASHPTGLGPAGSGPAGLLARGLRRIGVLISAAIAAALGLLPHVLHHAGPLAGAALFAGVGGSLLFGALGLIAAVPFLVRLRRRFGSWRVPAAALALFAAIFAVSAFAVGPAISGGDDGESGSSPSREAPVTDEQGGGHAAHH